MTRKKRLEFPLKVKKKVMERSGNSCERCGIVFDDEFTGEFHHIIPLVFKGGNTEDNCSLLCSNCHRIAPNIRNKDELLIYNNYFLRFSSFEEAAQYYNVDNRFDLFVKVALDIAKMIKK
jgi:5-methylcytosine-specific restriction endonuclease McrA